MYVFLFIYFLFFGYSYVHFRRTKIIQKLINSDYWFMFYNSRGESKTSLSVSLLIYTLILFCSLPSYCTETKHFSIKCTTIFQRKNLVIILGMLAGRLSGRRKKFILCQLLLHLSRDFDQTFTEDLSSRDLVHIIGVLQFIHFLKEFNI